MSIITSTIVLIFLYTVQLNAQYGHACGFAGTTLPIREEVETLIHEKNQLQLTEWLYSNDKLKQVYGAEALIRLHNAGTGLSKNQLRKIIELKNSEIEIMTCSGCIMSTQTMKSALFKYRLKE